MRAAIAIALVSLLGCRVGPGREDLQRQIQTALDESFGAELFEVSDLSRRGHYSYDAEGDEREHVLVYYDARIRFVRDHLLSDWSKLNVGSLISVLGATPNGVEGVKPEGNKTGDLVEARGAFAFARAGDCWERTRFRSAEKSGRSPASIDKDKLPYRQHLKQLGELGATLHAKQREQEIQALTGELARLLSAAERRKARGDGSYTLATGGEAGEYFRQGTTLARLLSKAGHPAKAFASSGSAENCRLVARGEVEFAYAQNDIAAMAHRGSDLFAGEVPAPRLRALSSLYPEAVHVVVAAGGDIVKLGDLRGRRVDIGPEGSGSRINAVEVLAAAGLGLGDLAAVQGRAPRDAVADLERGAVDAVIITSAFPAPQLASVAEGLRLLPLDDVAVEALRGRSPHLISLWIPEKTYAGMDQGCRTVGVTAMLVARDDASAERVERLLSTLFGNVEQMARDSDKAFLISRERARDGLSIPLHPAAEAFLAR